LSRCEEMKSQVQGACHFYIPNCVMESDHSAFGDLLSIS